MTGVRELRAAWHVDSNAREIELRHPMRPMNSTETISSVAQVMRWTEDEARQGAQ